MQFIPLFLGGVQALGSMVAGAEERNNLRAVEDANRLSASYARDSARNELRIATADAESQRRRGREVVSEQTAAFSQSGFSLTDSAAMSIGESAAEAELDALTVQYKGVLRNRAGLQEAQNFETAADSAKRARKASPFKTVIGAATNLLSGYANYKGVRIV